MASLKASIGSKHVETVVSTTDMAMTKGRVRLSGWTVDTPARFAVFVGRIEGFISSV